MLFPPLLIVQFHGSMQVHIPVQTSPLAVYANLQLILKKAERLKNCLSSLQEANARRKFEATLHHHREQEPVL